MTRRRRTTLATLAVASIGVLGACAGKPSVEAVVKDAIQSMPDLTEAEVQCRLDVVDEMSNDELEALGDANVEESITDLDSGTPEMQAFSASLAACDDAS